MKKRKIFKVPEDLEYTRSLEDLMEKSANKIGSQEIRLR